MIPSIEAVEAALSEFVTKDVLLRKEPLGRDVDLFDAGFDSLSLSRVLVFVEQRFGAAIPDQDVVIDEIATIASMARFVHGYVGKTQR
ncbi:MAG: acyl carrier protein [Polyangiaceae bacterium]|nr:acyl carrier protein [Polyangiaceae bacterium]